MTTENDTTDLEQKLRERFEQSLPELLEHEMERLREKFENDALPAMLEETETELRDQFESDLPDRVAEAEQEQEDEAEQEDA